MSLQEITDTLVSLKSDEIVDLVKTELKSGADPREVLKALTVGMDKVGKLFEKTLGLPYTEDVELMTNAARQTLRQVFLDAPMGISGVNFGVAETGTLCVVTNEGNGRMVTTLPRTHVALMGLERIVPTLDDLALMLSLLPRSATGQKLSVYTSLLNSPRRPDDPDGPQERHLILVDNGRMAVRASALREILYCIRCGSCLNACPVFREIGGHAYVDMKGKGSPYPGPIGSVISPALFGQANYGHLARASSLCGACREACPVDIDLPKLLLRVRAGIQTNATFKEQRANAPAALAIGLGLFTLAASSSRRFAAAQWLAGLFGSITTLFSKGDPWIKLPALSGWGFSKDFPSPAGRSFRSRYKKQPASVLPDLPQPISSEINQIERRSQPEPVIPAVGNLMESFAVELEKIGGKFISCRADEGSQKILEILHANGIGEILSWEADHLPEGLLKELLASGIQVNRVGEKTMQENCLIRAGITGATAAIAETGTLLILGGVGQPLTASLLPEIHIAVVREKDIFRNLTQVISMDAVKQASAGVLVSGPSRTADIEMTLTIGVHGPGKLHVICIKED